MPAPPQRSLDPLLWHRLLFALSLATSTILAIILFLRNREWGMVLAPLVLMLCAVPPLMGRLFRSERILGVLLTVAAFNAGIIVPELALRVGGFSHQAAIQFGYPRPQHMIRLEADESLFWRLPSSRPDINSLGFPGGEPVVPKPDDTFRIVFLGDSCTFQGYPTLVGEMLRQRSGSEEGAIDIVNLSVPGYSSHQGRVIAETLVPRLEPDLVFVYYGWNDHWLAYGAPDADKIVRVPTGLQQTRVYKELANTRVVQFGHWLVRKLRGDESGRLLDQVRVPEPGYRENLRAIRDRVNALSVPVIFITAPTSHYARGVPEALIRQDYGASEESITTLHRRYNEITREVAAEGNSARLLDLERQLSHAADVDDIFLSGGIHFSGRGARLVAERVANIASPHVSAIQAERDAQ